MPAPIMINRFTSSEDCRRDRVIVYYEAKNREEFLELREKMRSGENDIWIVSVIALAVILAMALYWARDKY